MLNPTLKTQLKGYLERLQRPIELVASLDDSAKSKELLALLQDIVSLSPLVSLVQRDDGERSPSFTVGAQGQPARIRFAGIPLGHEFTSLVLALLQTGGHPPKVDAALIEQIQALEGPAHFEVYMSLSCHNCPDVVQALNLLAVLNPAISAVTIDGALFQDEVTQRKIMAVPTVFLNGQVFGQGRMAVEEIVAKLDSGSAKRDATRLAAEAPYDMLIVGGGPAGAAAAVYAARKGIRTGVLAERFGGQRDRRPVGGCSGGRGGDDWDDPPVVGNSPPLFTVYLAHDLSSDLRLVHIRQQGMHIHTIFRAIFGVLSRRSWTLKIVWIRMPCCLIWTSPAGLKLPN